MKDVSKNVPQCMIISQTNVIVIIAPMYFASNLQIIIATQFAAIHILSGSTLTMMRVQ